MSLSMRWKFALTASMVLFGSLARPGGGNPPDGISTRRLPRVATAPGRAREWIAERRARPAPASVRAGSLAVPAVATVDPEPWFSITWTATSSGFSDVTDTDGTRTVVSRKVVISGTTIVRRFPDETQDSFSPDITVTDEYDRVVTTPCVNTGGVDRNHIRRRIIDPLRYQGTSPTVQVFPPQQRLDGSWYLFDPFISFYSGRFFTYRSDTEHFGCDGEQDVDSFDDQAGFYADTALPGDLDGDKEGVTFRKQTSFDSPFSNDPPMHVVWTVVARKLFADDLTVERLEVTQGLQAADNGIPLVNGRRTVVRAYLGIGGRPGPVPSVSGILRGFAGETPLGNTFPFNPGREIDAPAAPNWRKIDDTLNFEVPLPWTLQPALRLEVEVNHERIVFEDDYSNNKLAEDVALYDCQPMKIDYLPIHYVPPQGFNPSDPSSGIHLGQKFLQKVYPVAQGDLSYWLETGFTFSEDVTDGIGPVGARLVDQITQLLLTSSLPRPDRLFGWLPAHASTTANGRADQPGVAGWVVENTNPNTWRASFAHEVGHTYGRDHTGSTTAGRHWFDVSDRKVQNANPDGELFDFIFGIGHDEPKRWVAPETYNFLFGKLCGGASAQTLAARASTVGDNLLLSGIVNNTVPPTGTLDPLFRTSTAPTHIPDPPIAGPGYCVKLKDGSGAVLSQYCFDVTFEVEPTTPGAATASSFGLVVPYPPGLARVELTRGTSTVLDFRTPSAHAPAIALTYPNAPGLTLSGVQTLTWNAGDADGDALTYSLFYTKDDGTTWKGLAAGLTAMSYPLDFSQVPGSATARIRVQASDGFLTAEDSSDNAFAVGKKVPIVAITSPPPAGTFNVGLPVTLQATGTDFEDRSLSDAAFSWSSNSDGALGTGRLLEKVLSPGTHVVTVTLTDSDGMTATDSVSLTVTGSAPTAPGFYTVPPCRVADTRDSDGPWGGPALSAGAPRTFTVGGRCGVTATAKAVSFNFTITQPAAGGHVTVFPEGGPPVVSTMNFRAGQTRANNAIVALGPGGTLVVVSGQPSGTTHLIIDVNGYFE